MPQNDTPAIFMPDLIFKELNYPSTCQACVNSDHSTVQSHLGHYVSDP